MRIRKKIGIESGIGQLSAGGELETVTYSLETWGTYESSGLCQTEVSGSLEGERTWFSGVAELTFQDGQTRRILLRRCGTFACAGLIPG